MPQPLRLNSKKENEESVKRACDSCRKKKIRCEPVSDVCAQCIKSKTTCHFTLSSVLKSRKRQSRDRRVEELEKRLAWMEGQLRLPKEGRQFPVDLEFGTDATAQNVMDFAQYQATPIASYALSKSSLDSRSPEIDGSVRVSQTSNITTPSQQMLISDIPRLDFGQNTNSIIKSPPIFQHLPPKQKALRLITLFFQGFNSVYPLFDQDTFLSKFHSTYGLDTIDSDPGWWAALNIVFALAYQHWDMPLPDAKEDLEAWGYFQNALDATNQLITRHYTLASVQALLGMAMLMMATPHQRPITLLISSAIKIAHELGLHRQDQYPALSAEESAERMRVFWVAYTLDKDVSLQTKQPPTQGEDDMDIEPPGEDQPRGVNYSLFYFRTRLALIQGQIYWRLLSVKAGKSSISERAMVAEELEMTLQTWRRSIPIELFCDYSGPALDASPADGSSLQSSHHPVYLQLLYFKTLAAIHESLPTLPWYPEIRSSQIRVHILSAPVTYPAEARSAMKLLNVTPRRKFLCIWSSLNIFTTATTTLLIHTISNPSNPLVQMDLQLLEPFLNFLGVVAKSGVNEQISETYHSNMVLFEQAKMAVGQSTPVVERQRYIGKGDGARESVEDFLERMENIRSGDSAIGSVYRDAWE